MTETISNETLPTTITVNGKEYSKIELKGRKLFEFMQLARSKNIDRSIYFKNLEAKKFREPISKLAEEIKEKEKKLPKSKKKKFDWYVENDVVFKDKFVAIMLDYIQILSTEINKVLIECDYEDLVEVISIGFQMAKDVVEEFPEDNFMTAIAILNNAFPSEK